MNLDEETPDEKKDRLLRHLQWLIEQVENPDCEISIFKSHDECDIIYAGPKKGWMTFKTSGLVDIRLHIRYIKLDAQEKFRNWMDNLVQPKEERNETDTDPSL